MFKWCKFVGANSLSNFCLFTLAAIGISKNVYCYWFHVLFGQTLGRGVEDDWQTLHEEFSVGSSLEMLKTS